MKVGFVIVMFAIAVLCTSVLAQEMTADGWFKKGQELIGNGSKDEGIQALDKALQLYNESIEQNPKDANAWLGKGNVFVMLDFSKNNLGMFNGSQSLAAYDEALKIAPKNVDALIAKGFVLFEMGFSDKENYNRSLEALDKALQIDTKNPKAWDFKGSELFVMGRYNESLEAHDKAIENIDRYTEGYPGHGNQTEELSGLWLSKGVTLQQAGRIDESFKAFDKAVLIDPRNYDAWMFKGQALDRMGRYNDSASAFENASRALHPVPGASVSSIAYAWISKADVLTKAGRYNESKAIYDKTVELNYSTNSSLDTFYLASAWRGEGSVLAKLGKYNQSLEAFNKSIDLGSWKAFEAWTAEGNALRDMGRYNESLKAYDKAIETAPNNYSKIRAWIGKGDVLDNTGKHDDAAAAYKEGVNDCDESLKLYSLDGEVWYYKGTALKALGRTSEADTAFTKAKGLGYEVRFESQTKASSTSVKMLAITAITAVSKDKSIEITNSRTKSQSFKGWTLNINDGRNRSMALPDFTLGPDKKANIHFGRGKTNETDLFLNGSIALNDTAGDIILKNETGKTAASFGYRVEPDGSVTGTMVAKGEFSYPRDGSNDVKMVVREAGDGPYATERTEYEPEAARSNASVAVQENTTADRMINRREVSKNDSFKEAISSYDKILQREPGNISAYLGKAQALMIMGKQQNEFTEILQKVLNLTNKSLKEKPQDANVWQSRGVSLAGLGKDEAAVEAFERSIELLNQSIKRDPKDADAWWLNAENYEALGRPEAAIKAYDKVIELNSTKAVGAWIRKADIFSTQANGYNKSVQAFSQAVKLMPDNATWAGGSVFDQGNYTFHVDFWSDDDRILRVSIGHYNKSIKDYDFIEQVLPTPIGNWLVRDNGIEMLKMRAWPLWASGSIMQVNLTRKENTSELWFRTGQEQDVKYWYEKGQKLDANQSYEDAVQAYENAIKLDPQNSEFLERKALSLYFLHRNQEATESWKKVLQLYNETLLKNPNDIKSWMGKGRVFTMLAISDRAELRENYRVAELNAYEQGLQIAPQNSTMLYFKGSALYELKRYDEAITACDQALKIGFDPSQPWMADGVSHLKGLAEAALGKKNDSVQSYQEALKGSDEAIKKANSPQNLSEAWAQKGMMLEEQGNYNESVKAFDNATNANPKNEMAWKFKGFMLANWMGRYQEGLAALDRALEIRPAADVWEAKGRVFNELGKYQDAIATSDKALALNQNLTTAWRDKGRASSGLGRYQEASDAYSRDEDADDESLWAGRGFALANLNRSGEAIAALNKSLNISETALQEDNKSAHAWFWKGEALRGLGRYQEALEAYNHSLETGRDYAISSWRGKGYAFKALGRNVEADAALAKARELGYQG